MNAISGQNKKYIDNNNNNDDDGDDTYFTISTLQLQLQVYLQLNFHGPRSLMILSTLLITCMVLIQYHYHLSLK